VAERKTEKTCTVKL